MNKEFALNMYYQRIEKYLEKTRAFNDRKTVLICDVHEVSELLDFFLENKLKADKLSLFVDRRSIFHEFELYGDDANYFISKRIMTDSIYNEIKSCGINPDNVYIGPTCDGYSKMYEKKDNIVLNFDRIVSLINSFHDNHSVEVLFKVLVRLSIPYQFHFDYETEEYPQYFNENFHFSSDETYLDAGVCNGINIFEFANAVGWEYNKIIGFEPDDNNYLLAEKNTKDVDKVELLKKVLYDYDGEIRFLSTNKSSKRSNSRVGEDDGDTIAECIKGDSLNEDFSFIKMDIEGSEMNALEGLRDTIIRCRPKLAICVYHFQSDFWEIPLKILEICPDYNIEYRNHKKMDNLTETIVYAW